MVRPGPAGYRPHRREYDFLSRSEPDSSFRRRLTRFESWRSEALLDSHVSTPSVRTVTSSQHGARRALVGGVIGAVGGVVFCTAVSNVANDSAGGFSTCTLKGYLLTGSVGFALGFAVGWLT